MNLMFTILCNRDAGSYMTFKAFEDIPIGG